MSQRDPDVVVVGSLHLDFIVRSPTLPALDETVSGTSWDVVSGGKGGNQARWASRLGANTAMISRVGDDDFGRRLLASLTDSGVDARGVGVDERAGSGMSIAILQPDGEYGAVIVSGSNLRLQPADALVSLRALGPPAVLLLQNEINENVNIAAARQARDAGSRVILNAAPARAIPAILAEAVDVLVVNRVEASMLARLPIATPDDAMAAAKSLVEHYPAVVLTLGSLGLVIAQQGRKAIFVPAPKVEAISAHGAGDCFIGQMAASLAQLAPLREACQRANETAAAYVSGQISLFGKH